MTQMSEEQLLDTISEHTTMMKGALWLRQIRYNQKHYGFLKTIKDIGTGLKGKKAIVLGAGPGFKRFGMDDLRKILEYRKAHGSEALTIFACDGALSTLHQFGEAPDFVVSVDAHPIVANFFRRNWSIIPMMRGALLGTAIHRDVVNECRGAGIPIYWWQPFFKTPGKRDARRNISPDARFYVEGIASVNTGGNVGTSSYIIASSGLGCRPVGLMGLEFAWSDETPLSDTQYFKQIIGLVGGDLKKARKQFSTFRNRRDGKRYIADPVYCFYRSAFRNLWKPLPREVRAGTFNLTKQGILSARGLKTITVEEFLGL